MAKTAVSKKAANPEAFSLKITLRHTKPPIWRRIVVPRSISLADLHVAIQVAMGWHDGHLHDFEVGGDHYGDRNATDDVEDERRLRLNDIARAGITRFAYTYDFGDNWEHLILIEKAAPTPPPKGLPACVAGKRKCPPEDCGGIWGYAELLEILGDPAHPRHAEHRDWIGGSFDADDFSVADTDALLAEAFSRT